MDILERYPKLKGYIKAARKRGYSDEEIDASIAEGFAARKQAGLSDEAIWEEFGGAPEQQAVQGDTPSGLNALSNPRQALKQSALSPRLGQMLGGAKAGMSFSTNPMETAAPGPFSWAQGVVAEIIRANIDNNKMAASIALPTKLNDYLGGIQAAGASALGVPVEETPAEAITRQEVSEKIGTATGSRLAGQVIGGAPHMAADLFANFAIPGPELAKGRKAPSLDGQFPTIDRLMAEPLLDSTKFASQKNIGYAEGVENATGMVRQQDGSLLNQLPQGKGVITPEPSKRALDMIDEADVVREIDNERFLREASPFNTQHLAQPRFEMPRVVDNGGTPIRRNPAANLRDIPPGAPLIDDAVLLQGQGEFVRAPWVKPGRDIRSKRKAASRYPDETNPQFKMLQEDARTQQMGRDLEPGERAMPAREPIPNDRALALRDPAVPRQTNVWPRGPWEGESLAFKAEQAMPRRSVGAAGDDAFSREAQEFQGLTHHPEHGITQDGRAMVPPERALKVRNLQDQSNAAPTGRTSPFHPTAPGARIDRGMSKIAHDAAQQSLTDTTGFIRNNMSEVGQRDPASVEAIAEQRQRNPQGVRRNQVPPDMRAEQNLANEFDRIFKSEFSAGPGTQALNDIKSSVGRVSKAIKDYAERHPLEKDMAQAIKSFQFAKRRGVLEAEDAVQQLREQVKRLKKNGMDGETLRFFQQQEAQLIKDKLGEVTGKARRAYIKTAKKLFPDVSESDILAEAGEVEALQKGLAMSLGARVLRDVGVGASKGVGIIKTIKVLGSTTAYANNVGSNMISTFLSGAQLSDVQGFLRAIRDLKKGEGFYQEALDSGIFGTEFFSKQLDDVFKDLERMAKDKKNVMDIVSAAWSKPTSGAAKIYDGIDKAFKLWVYTQARTRGVKNKGFRRGAPMNAKQAAEWVHRYFPDYERLPPSIQRIRKNPAAALALNPFLAFPVEYARIYKNAAQDNPHRMLGAVGTLAAAVAVSQMAGGEKPDYHKFPSKLTVAVPFTDDGHGKPRQVDLTYMVPLADLVSGEPWRKDLSIDKNVGNMMSNFATNFFARGFLSPTPEHFKKPGENTFRESIGRLMQEKSLSAGREFVQEGVNNLVVPPVVMKASQLGQQRTFGEDPSWQRELGEFAGVRLLPDSKIERRRADSELKGRVRDLESKIARVKASSADMESKRADVRRLQAQLDALKRSK